VTVEPPIPPEDEDLEAARRYAERLRDGEDPTTWLERADVRESLGRHTRRFAEHPDFFDAIEAVRRAKAAEAGDAAEPSDRDGT
jgi:hypothetical protein